MTTDISTARTGDPNATLPKRPLHPARFTQEDTYRQTRIRE